MLKIAQRQSTQRDPGAGQHGGCLPQKTADKQSSLLSKPLKKIPACLRHKHLLARLLGDFSRFAFLREYGPVQFHFQPAMSRFSPDQQESQRTTLQQPPQCLFPLISSLLLSLQSLTQGEQGSLEQPPLCTPASLISLLLSGFLDLAPFLLPVKA